MLIQTTRYTLFLLFKALYMQRSWQQWPASKREFTRMADWAWSVTELAIILDLLITNIDSQISNLSVSPSSGYLLSDHFYISFEVSSSYHPHHNATKYLFDYSNGDFEAFNEYLLNIDYTFCSTMDVDSAWSHLKTIISTGCSQYIPKIKIDPYSSPKWFNPSIRHQLNCVHSLRRRVKRSLTPNLLTKLANLEQSLQDLMLQARTEYEANLFQDYSNNCKAIHRYLNLISSSSTIPNQVNFKSISATTPLDKANLFNQYFHSVYSPPPSSLPVPTSSSSPISSITIEEDEVFTILSSLNPSKAMGGDQIGPKLLKSCASSLCLPLSLLFQRCIDLACIPIKWKHHVITPILKKGDPSCVTNYRPISLLSSVSKVLEKIVFDHVSDYIYPFYQISNLALSQTDLAFNNFSPLSLLFFTTTLHTISQTLST